MTVSRVVFDHVSFGVRDAAAALRQLRADFGAIPITGEQSPQFRYVISHVGTAAGVLVELMDAKSRPDGFLQRFLDRDGEGPHHLTFEVPDLGACIERLTELGIPVIQVNLDYPPWQEAFIHPTEAPGIVIQIAASTCHYPPAPDLLAHGVTVSPEEMPHSLDGSDRLWWSSAEPQPDPRVDGNVCGVALTVADLAKSDAIFAKALGAEVFSSEVDGTVVTRYDWDGSFVEVRLGGDVGLHRVYLNTPQRADEVSRRVAGIPFVPYQPHIDT